MGSGGASPETAGTLVLPGTTEATPLPPAGDAYPFHALWWKFTAPVDGVVIFSGVGSAEAGSSTFREFFLYDAALAPLGSNYTYYATRTVEFDVVAGQTYYLKVGCDDPTDITAQAVTTALDQVVYTDWTRDADYERAAHIDFTQTTTRRYAITRSVDTGGQAPPGDPGVMDPMIENVAVLSGGSYVAGADRVGITGSIDQTGGVFGGPTNYTAYSEHLAMFFAVADGWSPGVPAGSAGYEVRSADGSVTKNGAGRAAVVQLLWQSLPWQEQQNGCTANWWSERFGAQAPSRFYPPTGGVRPPLWDADVEGEGAKFFSINKGDYPTADGQWITATLPGGGVDIAQYVTPGDGPAEWSGYGGYVVVDYRTAPFEVPPDDDPDTPANTPSVAPTDYGLTESTFYFGGITSPSGASATYVLRPPEYRFYVRQPWAPTTTRPLPCRRYPRADRGPGVTRSYPRPSRRSYPHAP